MTCKPAAGKNLRMVNNMAVAKSQRKSVSKNHPGIISRNLPHESEKILQMLGFGMGEEYYGIDLGEATDVMRDLIMIQSCTTNSVTERFIRRNRRETIVFDLDHCLRIQGAGGRERNTTSFFMLDEKIGDCCAGILVPGVPSIYSGEYPKKIRGAHSRSRSVPPLRGIFRKSGPGSRRKSRDSFSLINLRECVENSIVHLKYLDSLQHNRN
jgi:hypothetical protein